MLYSIVLKVHAAVMVSAIFLFAASELLLIPARRRSTKVALSANRVANLFVNIGVLAGIALVYVGGWPLSTPWLLLSFVFIAALMVIGRRYVQPWQSVAATSLDAMTASAEVRTFVRDRRALYGRMAMIALFALIAGLMIVKPDLRLSAA